MNPWLLAGAAIAILIGAVLPLQALVNARLGQVTGGALFASFVSFLVGTLVLAVAVFASRPRLPTMSTLVAQRPGSGWAGRSGPRTCSARRCSSHGSVLLR